MTVKLKKWGNSLGLIVPKEVVREQRLKEGENVSIAIIKEADFSDIFGTLQTEKTAQQMKNEARKGWK